jgi:hypothetical protein
MIPGIQPPTNTQVEQRSEAIAKIEYPLAVAPGMRAGLASGSGGTQGNGRGAGRAHSPGGPGGDRGGGGGGAAASGVIAAAAATGTVNDFWQDGHVICAPL